MPVAATTAICTATLAHPFPAAAYNGNAAANYADRYATNYNTSYPSIWRNRGDDCTDFVSQAMRAGGYSMVHRNRDVQDDHNWFLDKWFGGAWWYYSHSWSVTNELIHFLWLDNPGGWWKGSTTGNSNRYPYWNWQYYQRWPSNRGLVPGDLLVYDWTFANHPDPLFPPNTNWSHASMFVGTGWSAKYRWWGDLVDAHTTDHWHAFWDLSEYNTQLWTTEVAAIHVDARNY